MKLIISSVSGEPIYEQIKTQIRSVLGGELKGGRGLPSLKTRQRLHLRTHRHGAYNELADEGVVQNIKAKAVVMDRATN